MKFAQVQIDSEKYTVRSVSLFEAVDLDRACQAFVMMNQAATDIMPSQGDDWVMQANYDDGDSFIQLFEVTE